MNKEEKFALARWAMKQALNYGAHEVSIAINENIDSSVDVREKKIDTLQRAMKNNLRIRLFIDQKYSSHATSRLDKKELAQFIKTAVESTKYLSKDKFRTLPDPSLYYKGEGKDLQILDKYYNQIDPQEKIDIAFATEKEVLNQDERIISVTTSYYDNLYHRVLVTSNGFEGDEEGTSFGQYASVSVNGGDARPSDYWVENALFYDKLKKGGVGKIALDRALQKIGQKKTESGKYDMIIENRSIRRILNPLISALKGRNIQQKNSFLIDRIGKQVVSDKFTLTDDPLVPSGFGSYLFDNEGLAAKKRLVFDKGILKTYFIDTYYAKKLEEKPTTGSTSNLLFSQGNKDMEGMVASMERGILVTDFNGGNCNGTTGDFSYGINGFLIENGKHVKPVSEMNITGNMKDLWLQIVEIGNDPYMSSSWLTPSILFKDVDFSGA